MNSMKDLWDSVLKRLSHELSETTINTWFDEVTVVTMEDSAFVLHCSNTFKKSTIEARFLPHIKAALRDLFSTDLEVKILDDQQLAAYHGVAPDRPGDLSESEAFTFETYVVGPQNKLAFAAAKAVTEKPGENYNPLFIYGDSGLGKTHLLYAIANALRKKRPEARIVYVKGDDFTNELIASIRENRNAEFREKYRQTDILLMDDIQFIAGKIQTQEEFFHTFNTLYESGRQIVLTSDRPPKEITQLEDRLRTRFEWGLMVDVAPPDFETRFAIVQNKAAMLGVKLPNEVTDYIAENITSNVRQIEGTLNKILAYRDLLDDQVNEETVSRAIRDMLKKSNDFAPTPQHHRGIHMQLLPCGRGDAAGTEPQPRCGGRAADRHVSHPPYDLHEPERHRQGVRRQGPLHYSALSGQSGEHDALRPRLCRKGEGDHHQHQQQKVKNAGAGGEGTKGQGFPHFLCNPRGKSV